MSNFPNIVDKFYRHFEQERTYEKQDPVTFAPSYLSSCKRQIFYKKTGTKPSNPIDLAGYFKMDVGKVVHERLQGILKGLGMLVSAEEHRTIEYKGLTFNYYYDGTIEHEGERILVEIKTVYAAGFRAVENAPKDDHIFQTLSYMMFEKIPRAIILYVGRDNGYMIQHNIRYFNNKKTGKQNLFVNNTKGGHDITQYLSWWLQKVNSLVALKPMIEKGTLPERDFEIVMKNLGKEISFAFQKDGEKYKGDYQCSYCQWKNKCWASELQEIKKHKFYIGGEFI